MSEFALGKCAMVQNGNWAWAQIKDVDGNVVKQDDIKFLPIYTGIEGEESQGICIGTENYFAVNSKASEAEQQASIDFINWLFTSDTGKSYVVGDLGFIAPFDTFTEEERPLDPLSKQVMEWVEKDNIKNVNWKESFFQKQGRWFPLMNTKNLKRHLMMHYLSMFKGLKIGIM